MLGKLFSHVKKNTADVLIIGLLITILVFTVKSCNVENFNAKSPNMRRYENINDISCPSNEASAVEQRQQFLKQAVVRAAEEDGVRASAEQINAAATLAPVAVPNTQSIYSNLDTDKSGSVSIEEAKAGALASVTTAAPFVTTDAPFVTTAEPVVTTAEPVVTTAAPSMAAAKAAVV